MMAGAKCVFLMDEITSGLDSATAFKEIKALKEMAQTQNVCLCLCIAELLDMGCAQDSLLGTGLAGSAL